MKTILMAAAALTAAVPAYAQGGMIGGGANTANLVVNGDFSNGATGFTSQYQVRNPGPNAGLTEGIYIVDTNSANVHPEWLSLIDHTTGSGKYMIVNGATSQSAGQSRVVWEQSIGVQQGNVYFFEAFAANICCKPSFQGVRNSSDLTFQVINGFQTTTLNTFNTGTVPAGQWQGLSNTYFVGGEVTRVTLRILNSNLTAEGNDFALDDIRFSTRSLVNPIPEPATWAMMIAGFGLVGGAVRRRTPAARGIAA